jgi:small GTP-binding protein
LLLRWTGEEQQVSESSPTVGMDFAIKAIKVQGKRIKAKVWDTAGQERFRTITRAYYRNAQGILLVYDVTKRQSFINIRNWMKEIDFHTRGKVAITLVGNKCDLVSERVINSPLFLAYNAFTLSHYFKASHL